MTDQAASEPRNVVVEKVGSDPEMFVLLTYGSTFDYKRGEPLDEFMTRAQLRNTGMPDEHIVLAVERARTNYEAEYAEAARTRTQ